MELSRAMRLLRSLLLLLQLFAFAFAVPSSTDPQLRRHSEHHLHTSASITSTPLSVWSALCRFFFDDLENPSKLSSPPQPATSLTGYTDSKAVDVPPSRKLLAQYGDQLVLRFNITTELEASSLAEASDILYLDVWGQAESWVDIRLSEAVVPSLLGLLPDSLQHAHKPLMQGPSLAQAIADTYPASSPSSAESRTSKWRPRPFPPTRRESGHDVSNVDLFFDDYRSLASIVHWMGLLESVFSSHVRVINLGSTYEGRNIPALRVGVRPATQRHDAQKRETVLVVGGQHAREWISTSTVSFVAHSLITSYGKDPVVTELLEHLDFVFVPTLNPDGYEYSWSVDRLWRKNRQATTLRFCRGVDLDRTWSFMWDGERTKDNPCSESFSGEAPFDAVESRRFAEWARNETEHNNVEFVGLLDLHSYSQQILYPYAFTCSAAPPTLEDLQELGEGLAKSIRFATGEHYKVIAACKGNVALSGHTLPRFEGGGGSALDWFYHELFVRKAFQIKLRDKGSYGFLLPKEHIIPSGLEILSLVKHFGQTFISSAAGNGYASADGNSQNVLSRSEPPTSG